MTLGPDDLPDPFGEGGLSQLGCVQCLTQELHVVFTADTLRVICPKCRQTLGEYSLPGTGMVSDPPVPGLSGRDTLGVPGHPEVHGGWYPDIPLPREPEGHGPDPRLPEPVASELHSQGKPPPLLSYSAGMCNAFLDGGPYDGQLTWIMNDNEPEFRVIGVPGVYVPTDQIRSGRRVFTWHG